MNDEPIRLLLVEGNPGDARLLRETLMDAGAAQFEMAHVESLDEAKKRLAQGGIDVVLLDLSLPDGHGLKTLLRARAAAADVPIVVLTGLDDEAMAVKAVQNGAQDYLVKGQIDSNLLARSVRYAIERARTLETLRQRTLELQMRNEELDAFAHSVTHDLKRPLSLMTGYADMLVEDFATLSDDEWRGYMHAIAQSGRKMCRVIDELLLLSVVRHSEMAIEPLDMASIVAEAQQRLADMVEEYHAEIFVPKAWPSARGHAPGVEEVWVNYIGNAIKYGGRPPQIELGATAQVDGRIRYWVHDNGRGLTPDDQARLFTPFTRLNQVQITGHGLGLSIARRIVEKIGGQVGAESEVGRGSVFSFTLPGSDS